MVAQYKTTRLTLPPTGQTPQAGAASLSLSDCAKPLPASARPEAQLLLACARTVVDEQTARRIKALLREDIDWAYLLGKAYQHRVTPLLYQNISTIYPRSVPRDVLDELRQHTEDNARYNLYRTGELIKLLRLLDRHEIPSLPFKGPILSAQVYRSLALREYGDLDILVHQQNVLRTKELLATQGYRLVAPSDLTRKDNHFSPRNKDLIFESANGRVRVELHWRLTGRYFNFPLDLKRLWERLATMSLAGATVRTLAPEELLLYLCMHGSRHGWERLLWICDVAELLRTHRGMNWTRVLGQAHMLGCERMLAFGLLLAKDLLGATPPAEVWQKVRVDASVKSLTEQVRETLFQDSDVLPDISYWYDIHLRERERVLDRVRLHLHYYRRYLRLAVVPNERDHALLPLPRFLSSLYYLLRPFRLLTGFGRAGLKKLMKMQS